MTGMLITADSDWPSRCAALNVAEGVFQTFSITATNSQYLVYFSVPRRLSVLMRYAIPIMQYCLLSECMPYTLRAGVCSLLPVS